MGNGMLAQTDNNWTLKQSSEGISVFTRDVENSKFKALRVKCVLHSTLSQLVLALMDVNNSEEWIYHTSGVYVVKQVSPAELYYYSMVNMPWPASDRDFVAHVKVSQDAVTKVVTIDGDCKDDLVPHKPKIVRVTHSLVKWVLTPLKNGQVELVYTIHADPGGSLPAWLVNMFITQGPLQSIKKLRIILQKPVYKSARLDYIKE